MKNKFIQLTMMATMFTACGTQPTAPVADDFDYANEQFADLQMLRYKVHVLEEQPQKDNTPILSVSR